MSRGLGDVYKRQEVGKVGFRLGHGITLLFQKIKSQTISMEADHLALETYLIFAVQSNFHGKSSIAYP